jgi:hypothetical protein
LALVALEVLVEVVQPMELSAGLHLGLTEQTLSPLPVVVREISIAGREEMLLLLPLAVI